jgi:putative flippase GtrA
MTTLEQIIAFLFVGGLNTVVGYGLYAFFIYLGLNFLLAALFSNTVGIIFNFNTTGRLVFQNRDNSLFLRFIAVCVFCYACNVTINRFLQSFVPNLYWSGFLTVFPVAVITFTLNKFYVFKMA